MDAVYAFMELFNCRRNSATCMILSTEKASVGTGSSGARPFNNPRAVARIFSVAVRNGYSSVPLESLNPDVIIPDLTALPDAIEAWRQHG